MCSVDYLKESTELSTEGGMSPGEETPGRGPPPGGQAVVALVAWGPACAAAGALADDYTSANLK